MAPAPGTRLGPYEVTAQISVGGMAEVSKGDGYRRTSSAHGIANIRPAGRAAEKAGKEY